MELHIYTVGKPKFSYVNHALEEYLKRFPKSFSLQTHFLRASNATEEGEDFEEKTKKMRRVLLDEKGKLYTSRQFAEQMKLWHQQQPQPIAFFIGGADGLSVALKKSSYAKLSLSPLTFPHEMALLILTEQLYRARTILQGHPYHRDK